MAVPGFGGPADRLTRNIMARRRGGPAGGRPQLPPGLQRLAAGEIGSAKSQANAKQRLPQFQQRTRF